MIYWLAPRIFQTKLWSKKLAEVHFWIGTIGILFYVVSMYTAGITQGLMWRAFDDTGRLAYPDFLETVTRLMPMYYVRALGGAMFVFGVVLMVINFFMTWANRPSKYEPVTITAPPLAPTYTGPKPEPMGIGIMAPFNYLMRGGWHRVWERAAAQVHHLDDGGGGGGLAPRDHPNLPHRIQRAHHRRGEAVLTTRTLWARHLRGRRLLQLPLPNDSAHSYGDRALRRVLQAGRVCLRPSVPMGFAPYWS